MSNNIKINVENRPKRLHQYIAALGANFGGFALGTVFGWFSPAHALLKDKYNLSDNDITWISSLMPIGAALAQIYTALTLDYLGYKKSMIIVALPFIGGWIVLAFAKTAGLLCVGRFITGFCGGCFHVTSTAYVGELADKDVRGTLSSLFIVLTSAGILFSYTVGIFKNMIILTLPLCIGPGVVFSMMLFLPESPVFLYRHGQIENARKVLKYFRGSNYNIDAEMKEIECYTGNAKEPFWKTFKTLACRKALLMLLAMHAVQQLSGISAITFFTHDIVKTADSKLGADIDVILIGIVQVIVSAFSAYFVDKLGRRKLWIISLLIMCISLIITGMYFFLQRDHETVVKNFTWLPVVGTCTYLAGFSLGAGPLPCVMIGEFLPVSVKNCVGPCVAFFCWLLAFAVTKSFIFLKDELGQDVLFYLFAAVCVLGLILVLYFVIETKNKTLEDIQKELENKAK